MPIPAGRLRILLTSLVLSANRPVGVDALAEQLWPEQLPLRARGSVHTYVGRLRKLLGPDMIRTHPGGGYQLSIAPDAVDVHRFRDLLHQAQQADSADEELTLLRAALKLWRGAPFADLYSVWLDQKVIPRLTEEWFAAIGRRIELELASGVGEPLIAELRALVNTYPMRESLWIQLITALHRAGRRSEALDAFLQVRTALREQLGIDPSEQLVQLQQHILREGSPHPGGPHPRQLPHDITRFTGRRVELAMLDELLPNAEPAGRSPAPTIVSIDGAPGVGKTALAVHWAHRVANRFPDLQLYLNLRGYGPGEPVTPEAATETLLRGLGVDSDLIPSQLDERSALLRSTLSGYDPLILLDNARDAEQVRPLLPGASGLVIVTSRNQLSGLSIRDGAHRVTLHRLPGRQSVELLAAAVGVSWVTKEPAAAATLAELCDHLPLALTIVAERAHRAGSLAEVVTALQNEQARLDTLDTGEDNPDTSLRAALSWSYQALSPNASAMFRKLGMHPANDIGLDAAAALADVPVAHAQAALHQLVSAHLVEQPRPNRYELHDLIRLYATEMAGHEEPAERDATVRRTLDWYLHAASGADRMLRPHRRRDFLAPYQPAGPLPDFESPLAALAWFGQEYECLRSVAGWAAEHGFAGHAWRIAMTMTTFFDHTIPWRDGVEFYRFAFAAAETAGELAGEAYTLNSLGCIYLDMSDWNTAQSCFSRSFTRFQTLSNHFGEALTLGNLALVLGELGDCSAARRHARQALEIYERLDYPRGTSNILDNLGVAHMASGDYQQAVECFQQHLEFSQKLGDLEFEAWSQLRLGHAYSQLRDFPNATHAFRLAISVFRTFGSRRWEAIVLVDFGKTLTDAGHPTIARAMWRRALVTLTEFADPRAQELKRILREPTADVSTGR